tara:strand:- start:995 stop:1240 length:246 start_codon:yes stop_codon:yes gene_type:complete
MSTIKAKQFHLIEDLDIAAATYSLVERIEALVQMISNTLSQWASRSRDRRHLASMNERMLQDIGLSRGSLEIELSKYFWQK